MFVRKRILVSLSLTILLFIGSIHSSSVFALALPIPGPQKVTEHHPDNKIILNTKNPVAGNALSFTVNAYNQNIQTPADGNTKFVPSWWEFQHREDFSYYRDIKPDPPYSIDIKNGNKVTPGKRVIKVEYKKMIYDGNKNQWINATNNKGHEIVDNVELSIKMRGIVKFNKNGGTSLNFGSKEVDVYGQYGELPKTTKEGYLFNGWYTKKVGGEKIKTNSKVKIQKNSTFYAHFSKDIKVKFNANKGKVNQKSKRARYSNKYGKLPKAKKRGYTFKGWYTKKKGGKKITNQNYITKPQGHTLYAQWGKSVKVTFNPGKGKVKKKRKYVPYDGRLGNLPKPKRNGYYFVGWYSSKKYGKKKTENSKVKSNSNIILYAHWEKKGKLKVTQKYANRLKMTVKQLREFYDEDFYFYRNQGAAYSEKKHDAKYQIYYLSKSKVGRCEEVQSQIKYIAPGFKGKKKFKKFMQELGIPENRYGKVYHPHMDGGYYSYDFEMFGFNWSVSSQNGKVNENSYVYISEIQ